MKHMNREERNAVEKKVKKKQKMTNCINSMGRRLKAVIEKKGAMTPY